MFRCQIIDIVGSFKDHKPGRSLFPNIIIKFIIYTKHLWEIKFEVNICKFKVKIKKKVRE